MKIKEILDELETCGNRKSPRILWETSLYYYGSIMLNKYRYRKTVGTTNAIRYYSIFFGPSAIGKSWSSKKVEKLFKLENYANAMLLFYKKQISLLPEEPEEKSEIIAYMPKSITVGIEGTAEGLFNVIKSQVSSGFGSINLFSEEFAEHITSSSGLLSKLKECYDTKFQAKIIKGMNESSGGEMKADIENITCNFLGLGSKKAANEEAEREIKRILSSGLFRRTFIIESDSIIEKNRKEENIKKTELYIDELNEYYKIIYIEYSKLNIFIENDFTYNSLYEKKLDEIDDDLIDTANNDKLNEFAKYSTGSLEMIIDLSHIIAFLEKTTIVTHEHLDTAYDFFLRTRKSVEDTFKSVRPYKLMYDLLMLKDNMTISEMAEYESNIPISKTKVEDNIKLLEELCYRHDKILLRNNGKVTRYKIEDLPENNLKKLIVSIHNEGKGTFAINYKPAEFDWEQIAKLVKSKKVESFTTSHFMPSKQAPDGHRQSKSYIEGSNLIVFDIDDGMTIEEAKVLLSEYTYLIYTSKSHNIEKYNFRDRFRIILPTKNTFYVTPDQHKQLYINIEDYLGIKNNDVQTRNVSRLWYTNENAEIIQNIGSLLDVTFLLPNTDKSEDYIPKMQEINKTYSDDSEIARRMSGMVKWALQNCIEGQRNSTLYSLGMFAKDLGIEPSETVIMVNNMSQKPLHENDIKTLLRSINS